MVGYLLASDVDPMLFGQHWPNNQNVVQPTLFDDIGPTLGQFSYAGWVVHQSLAGQTPACLVSDIQLIADTGRHQLWSTSERMCVVPCTHNSFGDRSFSAAVPRVWNALPSYLRQDTSCTDISNSH